MPYTTSPNMSLQIPSVGTQPGPDYAQNVNTSLSLIDQHDHSSGSGVQITPDGLNIISDLTFNANNAIDLRSVRFESQGTPISDPTDLGCLYVADEDLYYNDTAGNQVRITIGGQVNSSAGSITGLVAPASASYSSGSSTFTWESDVNTPAAMDNGPVTVRELVLNGEGVTLTAPAGLSASYDLTFPAALPGTDSYLTVDSSGNIGTRPFQSPIVSTYVTFDTNTTTSYANVTDGSGHVIEAIITTEGEAVQLQLVPDAGLSNVARILGSAVSAPVDCLVQWIEVGNGTLGEQRMYVNTGSTAMWPPGMINQVDYNVAGTPGTYTYRLQFKANGSSKTITIEGCRIVASLVR